MGEEVVADAALNAQIEAQLGASLMAKLEKDPVAHLGDALSSVASSSTNPEAAVAMHEDLIEVLNDVRREVKNFEAFFFFLTCL